MEIKRAKSKFDEGCGREPSAGRKAYSTRYYQAHPPPNPYADQSLSPVEQVVQLNQPIIDNGDSNEQVKNMDLKGHKCSVCGRGFSVKSNMTQYMQLHSPKENVCETGRGRPSFSRLLQRQLEGKCGKVRCGSTRESELAHQSKPTVATCTPPTMSAVPVFVVVPPMMLCGASSSQGFMY
ncbi:hypothetical protein ATANTOWER_022914, partial [Ataeniobius toweri]|nr:hypothetical protein [Ataeniobius toweri]